MAYNWPFRGLVEVILRNHGKMAHVFDVLRKTSGGNWKEKNSQNKNHSITSRPKQISTF
jgi:hypothetical protein